MTLETLDPSRPTASDVVVAPAPVVAAAAVSQEPQVPLPAPLVNIWESFVLDQASRGRTEVQYMVPILISMLSERGVAQLRPDETRRRRLERWRDVLKGELTKIGLAKGQNAPKGQASDALQDGFRAIDIPNSSPLNHEGADTGNELTYRAVLMFTRSELEEHKRNVGTMMAPALAALKELNRQQEVMVRHRLQLMQRLSSYSGELLEIGQTVVRKYQASEVQRITVGSDADEDIDAALASLLPPPVQVTYGTVFNTFWQIIERFFARIMVWEPPAVKAWRRRVTAQLAGAIRQHRA